MVYDIFQLYLLRKNFFLLEQNLESYLSIQINPVVTWLGRTQAAL